MLYNYEAAILRYIGNIVPDIKEATYAKEFDLFKSMIPVTKYPAFYYYREPTEWTFNVIYEFSTEDGKTVATPFIQTYIGKIFVESTYSAQKVAETLRFGWREKPFVVLDIEGENIKVALRLQYIKIDEDRNTANEKGTQRYIEFKWTSQLVAFDTDKIKDSLVEEVRFYMGNDGSISLESKNLIKTIR